MISSKRSDSRLLQRSGQSYTLQLFSLLHTYTQKLFKPKLYSFLRSIFSFFLFFPPNFTINHILHFVISPFHSSFCANAYEICGWLLFERWQWAKKKKTNLRDNRYANNNIKVKIFHDTYLKFFKKGTTYEIGFVYRRRFVTIIFKKVTQTHFLPPAK